jgi:hypothetical protein
MQVRCPCCHAPFSLEAVLQDEAARDFTELLVKAGAATRPLVTYIGFFRSASRALAWDRALRLATEVLELGAEPQVLAAALVETCASLDEKRAQPGWKPMSNHNYLKRVLESVAARVEVRGVVEPERHASALRSSRVERALRSLTDEQ